MNKPSLILLAAISLLALNTHAQEAPASQVVNVFACKLNEGKTMDNVWSALEALAKMNIPSQSPPDPAGSVFLWTPFRSGAPYDYVWGYTNSSLSSMSRDMLDYVAAPGMEAMEERFADTGKCISMVAQSRNVRTGAISNKAGRTPVAVVEAFGCDYAAGAGPKQLDEVVSLWQRDVEKIASPALKGYAAWVWTPFRGGTGESDWFWIGAYPDITDWAKGSTDYYASKEGAAVDARFNATNKCHANLWVGYWITAPTVN